MKKFISAALALLLTLAVLQIAAPGSLTLTASAAGGGLFACRDNALAFEDNKIIFAKVRAADDAAAFITPAGGVSYSTVKRFGPCIGTESVVTLTKGGTSTDYTVIVDGDTDCDGVSDVLDTVRVERALSGLEELTSYQKLAANSGAGEDLDVNTYQNVVNVALGKPTDTVLTIFNRILNSVKNDKPGFACTKESVCTRCAITTTGYPISSLNAEDEEMLSYLETNKLLLKLTSSTEEYNAMVASVEDAYQPKSSYFTVQRGSDDHYYRFPVKNGIVSSMLTANDEIGSITRTAGDTATVYTATFGEVSYASGEDYVSAYQQCSSSYAKVFAVPQLSSTDNVIGMTLKNGVIKITVDNSTGKPVKVEYSYTYVLNVTNPSTSEKTHMSQKNTVDVSEVYVIG